MLSLGQLEDYMRHKKESNSTNGYSLKTVFFLQTKNKMRQYLTIISIFKTIKYNTESLLLKNGNQILQKVLNFLNYCFRH